MYQKTIAALAVAAAVTLTGCAQAGFFAAGNLTAVELAEPSRGRQKPGSGQHSLRWGQPQFPPI
jgi:hypothetical protein